jgi:hypothetical protein
MARQVVDEGKKLSELMHAVPSVFIVDLHKYRFLERWSPTDRQESLVICLVAADKVIGQAFGG